MVALPKGSVHQNPKSWAASCILAVKQANGRLQNDRTFYENLQDMYRQLDEGKTQ